MSSIRVARLVRLVVACVGIVALAYVVIRPSEGSGDDGRATRATTKSTTSSVFGPVPDTGLGVVRGANGAVLPITGGADGAWEVLTPCARTAVVDADRILGAHVVIDPGHGGEETGAVAANGLTESDLNLDVARRAAAKLEAAGATVVLTRDADLRVTIETRAAIAEALDPLVFLSIHHNSGPTGRSDRPGVEVYHQHDAPDAARLGGLLWQALQQDSAPFSATWSASDGTGVRARVDDAGEDYYGVLRRPNVPSVLVEALYLSGEPEAELLARPEIREAEAQAITDAIVTWLSTDRPGSGFIKPLVAEESAGGGGGTVGCEDPAELVSP